MAVTTTHARVRSAKGTRGSRDEPPYGRYAFFNPYNITLFAAGIVGGIASGHHWLVVVVCGLELLWLIFAPDSKILRRVWFDRSFAAAKALDDAERRKGRVAQMTPSDCARHLALCNQKQVIERLAKENPSLTVDLLAAELAKLDGVIDDFIELGVVVARGAAHAQTFDFAAMRKSWALFEAQASAHPPGDPRREVARKNLEVLRQRRRRYDDLARTVEVAKGQMDLIEHTVRLLGDEIMTIGSTRELGGKIDELRVAVEAVRETSESLDEVFFVDDADIEIEHENDEKQARS